MSIETGSTTDPIEAAPTAKTADKLALTETKETVSASTNQETEVADETLEASDTSEETDDGDGEGEEEVTAEEAETEEPLEKPAKKKNGFKKRIDKLNQKLSVKEQETEYWKQEALKGQGAAKNNQTQEAQKKVETEGKPKATDFDTHDEYVEALTDWKIEAKEKATEAKQRQTQALTEAQKQGQAFQEKIGEFKKTTKDFDEVLEEVSDLRASPGLLEVIIRSKIGPQLMYELAKDRAELERINQLDVLDAAKEIGKIEVRLSKPESPSTEKKQSKAPAPITPIGGSGSARAAKSIYDPNISQRDFERMRQKQMAER